MGLFKKNKKQKEEVKVMDVILCNTDIRTSEQLKSTLDKMFKKGFSHKEGDIFITQFGNVAMAEVINYRYEMLIIDYELEGSMTSKETVEAVRQYSPDTKILLMTSVITKEVQKWFDTELIDGYMLMPYQDSHLWRKVDILFNGRSDELTPLVEDLDEEDIEI